MVYWQNIITDTENKLQGLAPHSKKVWTVTTVSTLSKCIAKFTQQPRNYFPCFHHELEVFNHDETVTTETAKHKGPDGQFDRESMGNLDSRREGKALRKISAATRQHEEEEDFGCVNKRTSWRKESKIEQNGGRLLTPQERDSDGFYRLFCPPKIPQNNYCDRRIRHSFL